MNENRSKHLAHKIWHRSLIIPFVFLLLAACGTETPNPSPLLPTPEAVSTPISAWGAVELIAQAQSREAAVFIPFADGTVFSWTGVAENEARIFSRGRNSNAQIMAFKAFYPMEQQLFESADGILMLWLDRHPEESVINLWAGGFSRDGIAEIAAIQLSTIPTRRYSALNLEASQIEVVYSAGLGQINNLYRQQIDSLGRSFAADELRIDADFPALVQNANGELLLFWLEDNGQAAYLGHLGEEGIEAARHISQLQLPFEQAVEDFFVGYAGETAYLFWQVRAFDGSHQIWLSTGRLDGEFSPPTRFGINLEDKAIDTPYNLLANAAQLVDAAGISWAAPAQTVLDDTLALAAYRGNELGIVYLQAGTIRGYSRVIENSLIIAPPQLFAFPDGNLALSWAEPSPRAYANLFYTSSR